MPDSLREWIIGLFAILGSGGIGALVNARWKPSSRAETDAAQGSLTKDLSRTAIELLSELREERKQDRADIEALKLEVLGLKAENEECRRQGREQERHIEEMGKENAELRDRIRRLEEGGIARDIREAAETLPGTFTTIEGDRKTVMRPPARSKRGGQ